MKTVPHIVEDKHLKLFHPEVVKQTQVPSPKPRSTRKRTPAKKRGARPAKKRRAPRRPKQKVIKGRVTKKSPQSVRRRRAGKIKDIFSR